MGSDGGQGDGILGKVPPDPVSIEMIEVVERVSVSMGIRGLMDKSGTDSGSHLPSPLLRTCIKRKGMVV
jgi:hypothetical protein